MTSSLYGDSPSEAYRLKEANARITQLEATLAIQVKDEAEQDTAIRDIVRKIIGSSVDGDSYGVPPLCDVVESSLAAATVKVPGEVREAAERVSYDVIEDGFLEMQTMAKFILQLAGRKDGGNGN